MMENRNNRRYKHLLRIYRYKLRDLEKGHVLGLRAFLALGHRELDFLAFGQGLETGALDGGEVNEYVRPLGLLDEAKALGFVEPFYLAGANV